MEGTSWYLQVNHQPSTRGTNACKGEEEDGDLVGKEGRVETAENIVDLKKKEDVVGNDMAIEGEGHEEVYGEIDGQKEMTIGGEEKKDEVGLGENLKNGEEKHPSGEKAKETRPSGEGRGNKSGGKRYRRVVRSEKEEKVPKNIMVLGVKRKEEGMDLDLPEGRIKKVKETDIVMMEETENKNRNDEAGLSEQLHVTQ
jgi:hypothetical protein